MDLIQFLWANYANDNIYILYSIDFSRAFDALGITIAADNRITRKLVCHFNDNLFSVYEA